MKPRSVALCLAVISLPAFAQTPAPTPAQAPDALEITFSPEVSAAEARQIEDILTRSFEAGTASPRGTLAIKVEAATVSAPPNDRAQNQLPRDSQRTATVVASTVPDVSKYLGRTVEQLRSNFICEASCDIAAAGAAGACSAVVTKPGATACMGSAVAAREYCRIRC
ncbi:MAG: hypothetical protein JWN93_1671 [Hyphomicrobiales bacterium]|nr:hypothetical protein [Hyphomicrobiales bacterium]